MCTARFGEPCPYLVRDFAFEIGQVLTRTKYVKESIGVSQVATLVPGYLVSSRWENTHRILLAMPFALAIIFTK